MSQSSVSQTNLVQQYAPWLYSFWKFSRPHTIIGTSLSVFGLYAIATSLSETAVTFVDSLPLLGTWIACLCGNVYIVGLNQLEDIEIDRINKPHLPVAAGEYSLRQGQLIVAIAGILAVVLALVQGPWLLATVGISLTLGTAYSLPPIRLKRFPFWASFCIFTVRGVVVNLGLFLHGIWVLSQDKTGELWLTHLAQMPPIRLSIPPSVWALTLFVLGFTFAIAIFKDIPDIEGDKQYNISTFTIRLGTRSVFELARWTITVCYLAIALFGLLRSPGLNPIFLGISHIIALALLWWRTQQVDLSNKLQIASCYQFIWKLFFVEYIIFPLACLLA